MRFDPNQDGLSHINIYSKGKTELGRQLTNFSHFPIQTKDGKFNSVEGWWYWQIAKQNGILQKTGQLEKLRTCIGMEAKNFGRNIGIPDWPTTNKMAEFQTMFQEVAQAKIDQHVTLKQNLIQSSLPLTHYYVWGTPIKIHSPKEAEWITKIWEDIRKSLKA